MQDKKDKFSYWQFKGEYQCRIRRLGVVPGSIKENKKEGEEGEVLSLALKGVKRCLINRRGDLPDS